VGPRGRIIAAVTELSAERGYEATSIADIVKRARVARKTLYDNFDGKEEAFLAAVDSAVGEALQRAEAACESADGDWRARVEAGLGAFLAQVAEQPASARMCMLEALSATPASSARYDDAVARLAELLRRGTPEDLGLPETIEESLVGGAARILSRQIRRGEAERAMDLLPELSAFVQGPYLRP
jgi:AcrR family transcriptional regulator